MTVFMGMAQSSLHPKSSYGLKSSVNGGTENGPSRKTGYFARLKQTFRLSRHGNRGSKQNPDAPMSRRSSEATTTAQNGKLPPLAIDPETTAPAMPAVSRRVGPGGVVASLPRPPTFKRLQSEKRERLKPYETPRRERRERWNNPKSSMTSLRAISSQSASESDVREIRVEDDSLDSNSEGENEGGDEVRIAEEEQERKWEEEKERARDELKLLEARQEVEREQLHREEKEAGVMGLEAMVAPDTEPDNRRPGSQNSPILDTTAERLESNSDDDEWVQDNPPLVSKEIEAEMEWRWILNLSMHFRDESNREKFFVTYAQDKRIRRRLTISCDYRNTEDGTLEKVLSGLRYQRDKSAKIYEAIRESLQDIVFYETITNLKLQTSEGRLHVHVTEDLNEIIPYPPITTISHLQCAKYCESELEFDSHLSGFVYKVGVQNEIMIKKEIPGPDTVDEFLYEINALYALADSENVIRFGGCVVDDQRQRVKGLLISFASRGALIDILFNERGKLPWAQRERWAKQIVSGLSEIHEAGYVQGDFTLSNIVIDAQDDAKIIDINRRGCPIGWEPPEVTAMIDSLQRITMYIGVKSDIFQLGMVLWGLAHVLDEPEAVSRPLTMDGAPEDVPNYFRNLVEACMCEKPQGRPSAKEMISMFPERLDDPPQIVKSKTSFDGQPLPGIDYWGQTTAYAGGRNRNTPEMVEKLSALDVSDIPMRSYTYPSMEEATVNELKPPEMERAPSSVYDNDNNDDDSLMDRHVLSSGSSLVGGVGLGPQFAGSDSSGRFRRQSGVRIPSEDSSDSTQMPRRAFGGKGGVLEAVPPSPSEDNGTGTETEMEAEKLPFEDAREALSATSDLSAASVPVSPR